MVLPSLSRKDEAAVILALEEALRALGLTLEVGDVRRAQLTIDPVGIVVRAGGAYGRREYRWSELERQSRAQQAYRGTRPPGARDPGTATRWSALLRVVGYLLDREQIHYCVVDATLAEPEAPDAFQVRVKVADRVVLETDAVGAHLRWLRSQQVDVHHAEALPAHRPWWAIWRR
jgi:hypothetical protein